MADYLNNKSFESIIESFQFYKREKSRYDFILSDLKETHERRLKKYEDNTRLAIVEDYEKNYNESCQNYKQFQEQLAYAFYILSENIANYARCSGIDVDDAIQEGVVICFEKIDRFNPNYRGKNGQKAKAFNYMTTCILNHFRQLYRTARNYNELKKRYHGHLQDKLESIIIRNGKERNSNRSSIDRESTAW